MKRVRILGVMLLLALGTLAGQGIAWADTSSSTNYKVTETFFGSGGSLNSCSNAYCSKQSAGEIAAGRTASTSYQAFAGFNTTDVPMLELTVTGGSVNLGVQSSSATSSGSAGVQVRNYLSSGYVLQLRGTPPKIPQHTFAAPSTPTASQPGTEQFGVNLRQNTTPAVGADPVQVPSSSFSFGTYAAGYGTVDQFKYVNGDVVAQSASSSGETDYTISFIMNIAELTPAGEYTTDLSAVTTATF